MNMELINNVSAIATLILFMFYFMGRAITIIAVGKIWKDKVSIDLDDYSKFEIIDRVCANQDDMDQHDKIYGVIVSKEGIRNIRIYKVVPDEYGLMTRKGEQVYEHDFVNIDQAIAICTPTGDLYPKLIIEYNTADYMKVRIEWRDNLRNGVFGELICPKHTIKSFLYYFLR